MKRKFEINNLSKTIFVSVYADSSLDAVKAVKDMHLADRRSTLIVRELIGSGSSLRSSYCEFHKVA